MDNNYLRQSGSSKIKAAEILQNSFALYKNNFKLFIMISVINFFLSINTICLEFIRNYISSAWILIAISIFSFVIMILCAYYSTKIIIAFYFCISKRYKNIETGFKQCYMLAGQKVWKYIGVTILFSLILMLPMVASIFSYIFATGIYKYILPLVFLIPGLYLSTIYGYGPIIAIFEDDAGEYFKTSRELIKGNFWVVMLLSFLTSWLFVIPMFLYIFVFNTPTEILQSNRNMFSLINQFIHIFTSPISYSTSIILYYKLKEHKLNKN